MSQTELDFNKPIRHQENNPESQFIYEENEPKLRGQCKTVYEALKNGERLTTAKALIKYGIGDLRRRIKDLKDHYNIKITDEVVSGGYKEWFIPQN